MRAKLNPFTPRDAVQPDYFFGRQREINQIEMALRGTVGGKTHRILVRGDRGIGKTSIAIYAANMGNMYGVTFDPEHNYTVVFVRLGGCRTLDEVCMRLLNELHKRCPNGIKEWLGKALSRFEGLTIGPVGIQLASSKKEDILVPNFDSILEEIVDRVLKQNTSGLLLVIDETERFSQMEGAADFTKNFLEKLSADGYTRVMTLLTATPEGVDAFTKGHPSFSRLFSFVDLPPLSQEETSEVTTKTLQKGVPILTISDEVLYGMYYYSNGYPYFIQELGWWSFAADNDGSIDWSDFIRGVLGSSDLKGALNEVGDNLFGQKVLSDLKSEDHRKVLAAIASEKSEIVNIAKIRENVPDKSHQEIGALMRSLCSKDLVKPIRGQKGHYKLESRLFKLWLTWVGVGKRRRPPVGN